jgi:hypothetical protein
MEELREQLEAADPGELRRMAFSTLSKIMSKELDPRFRRVAIDTLRYLDQQEREVARVEFEKYLAVTERIAAVDAAEAALERRTAPPSTRRAAKAAPLELVSPGGARIQEGEQQRTLPTEEAQVTARRLAEIQQVVTERQMASRIEDVRGPALPKQPSRLHDPQDAVHDAPVANQGSRAVRRPGSFGRPVWMPAPKY